MKRHARSENRKIVRKLCDPGEGEAAAAATEIGSRVFPFRTPPPASMPSVGTRRSTRVFVPKAASRQPSDGESARILRSGKRLSLSKPVGKRADGDGDEWLRVFGNSGDAADLRWWKGERENGGFGQRDGRRDELVVPESDAGGAEELLPENIRRKEKLFGIVYCRKRQRSTEDDSVSLASLRSGTEEDRMYGIVFSRRQNRKKPKVAPLVEEVSREPQRIRDREDEDDARRTGISDSQLRITESVKNFAGKVGILEADIWTGLGGRMVLAVLVESSWSHSSYRFVHLLIPIMRWMRRARVRLLDLAAFLLSGSVASVFSLNGIHFLPVRQQKYNILLRNSIPGCGFCKIYGAREFIPMLSLDFSALPSYFKSLHATIVLGSQYFSGVFARGSMGLHVDLSVDIPYEEEYDDNVPAETGFSGTDVTVSETPAVKRNEIILPSVIEAPVSVAQNSAIVNGYRLRKHQRKPSSLRNFRNRHPSSMYSRLGTRRSDQNIVGVSPAAKAYSLCNSLVEPARVKLLESCLTDLFDDIGERDVASPPGSLSKQKKSARKSPVRRIKELKSVERIKEHKSALAEMKQNIDSMHCKANILVTIADRCWREEGAEVMLEMLGSNEWCIAVKAGGMIRYLHKPQDLRPCVVNRYTQAYMWTGEDGWRLEFCEKWDWFVFKELHIECRERNTQDVSVRIIPVPGVREVSGYEDNATPSFVRPDLYIHTMYDEVGRALSRETVCYDMDSADEEWIKHLNSTSSDAEDSVPSHISEENFERMIFALEKEAYNHPDGISDKDRMLDLCQSLGKRDELAAVFDYWLKKRNKKCTALVKVFQGPPSRRAQLIQKSFLRKKRSFKRQRSQAGRGKPDFFLEAGAKQEALRRVQEAESAASRAAEAAVHLRSRAQVLMADADLAAYKSDMVLRIAEALRLSSEESPDFLVSSILFD